MTASPLLEGLNASQAQAVTQIDGPLLVLAGPGSGKTRVITHRVAYMIESGIRPHNILALTFTNKAAGEMRGRLEQLVGPNDVWMGTFHGFCVRLLRRYARLAGLPENFSIYDMDDANATLKTAVKEAKFELTHVSLGTLAQRISFFKNRLITPEVLEAETLSSEEYQVAQVYPQYQKELLKCAAVDFDDILMHTAILLRSHPELRADLDAKLRYVMVDEYQDTNLAQYVIVRHLCVDHPNLAATGDPDQSVYGWRGANVKNITNLERDYPELQVVRLEENYRSTPQILSTADFLIQHNEYRKSKNLKPSRDDGNSVRLSIYPTARQEAEDIGDQIEAVVGQNERDYSDFGILYRTNAQSRLLEQALLRRQIPYQLIGGFRFYLRKEIKDLIAYLLLVYNPDDNVALRRAINVPTRGIGAKTVDKIEAFANQHRITMLEACRQCLDQAVLSKRATSLLRGFLKLFDQICSLVHGPLVDLLQTTIELTQYREYLLKQAGSSEDSSDVLANLDELLAEAAELDQETTEDQPALERFLEFAALQADTDKLKTDRNIVTLMTLHAAKGLEFSWVYIVAVEENILPHARSRDDPMQLEEERRLLFVGITRAKDQLQISYAKSRGFGGQSAGGGSGVPSSFLIELPRHEMQIVDRTENLDDCYGADSGGNAFRGRGHREWDEMSQLDEHSIEEHEGELEYDEDCQLPPDEIQSRLRKTAKLASGLSAQIKLGSDFVAPAGDDSEFQEGTLVTHPKFGPGEIVSAQGRAAKRAVTIEFFQDGSRRTFMLAHVELSVSE